jgi:putative salt-induced outer membrane protein YdiY
MKNSMKSAFGLTALAAALFATPALADQIKLNNGDVITGEILNKGASTVQVKTSYAGSISIAWKDIASVNADKPLNIMLEDDSIINATIAPAEAGKGKLKTADLETSSDIDLAKIKFINPTPIQSGVGIVWTGNVNLSGSMTKGNADNGAIRLAAEAVARSKTNRFTVGAVANQAESNKQDIEKNMRGYMQYDHFLTEKWYAYVNGSAEYDRFRDIQLRSRVGIGAGYNVYNTDVMTLDVEAGISYVNTDYFVGEDTNAPAARWALRYNHKLFGGNVVAFHNHEILFGLEDLNDSLIFTQTGLRFPISPSISATTQLNVDYAKTPAPGRKSTDTTFLFGVGYGW